MALKDREINYLGALLHDIGKLIWRAQKVSEGVDHEKLGETFIREHLGKIACLKENIEEIIQAANRRRGKIWSADIIAAEEREESKSKEARKYLQAITNRISLEKYYKKEKSANYFFFKPDILDIDKIIPSDSGTTLENFQIDEDKFIEEHKKLYSSFIKEVKLLEGISDFNIFLTTFYKLLEKYTSRVLSAGYLSHPDISLFDHSRITAALSLCFEEGQSDKPILLLKGDVTGIQDYIYGEVYKMENIAKRLRARSFFVQILLETITSYYLDKLNIFSPNVLYIGGGHFILLVPNNEENLKKINDLEKDISLKLISSYFGKVSYVQAYLELSGQEFINNFEESYNQLENLINLKKRQKNLSILDSVLNQTFEAKELRKFDEEIELKEEKIGRLLVKSNWIIQVIFDPTQSLKCEGYTIDFPKFQTFYYLVNDINEIEEVISKNNRAKFISIIKINDVDFILSGYRTIFNSVACEFKFIGNYVPTKSDTILSFEEIAKINSENYPLLGVLRLDIDSLGAVFRFGLKAVDETEKKYTPSRIAYLSRELNNFFSLYINKLAEKYQIYIAYSGGDDLFVVGSWINILNFAKDLRNDFRKFSSFNNYLSISGGIILTKPNFPISQSAILAGDQEKMAKDTQDPYEKDRIGIFDISFTWSELNEYINKAEKILSAIDLNEQENNQKVIPRSFIHSLLNLTKRSFDNKGKVKVQEFIRSKNKILYQFARRKVTSDVIENQNTNSKGEKIINEVLYDLALSFLKEENKEDFYRKFQLPATIVLYKTRR
ncbi:MAG: type III-A CRISPR-associated protein Cas10/Csm1 [Ignavibacteria bacterium]|jgi:CRISPR-associated protein Csm1|nr:type III-A CRISPR-associated protein Cas10/Csm1 [Ignavibacteria bacterium]MDH7527253.1 type III-A CRISPR-associated protein Cas10/Csm1 [Ignavibacteria bacterium]